MKKVKEKSIEKSLEQFEAIDMDWYYDIDDSSEASNDSFDLFGTKIVERENGEIKIEVKSEPQFNSSDNDKNSYDINVKSEIKMEPDTF